MWYVYSKDSNSHLADTVYVYVRGKKPSGDEWTGYDAKGDAVRDALGQARLLAQSNRPVQVNIQGKEAM